jgi:serine/threonine transporter
MVLIDDLAESLSDIVRAVIRCAPLGILGLVAGNVAGTGFSTLAQFSHLLLILLSAMLIVILLVNPLIVFAVTRTNPYPLILICLPV